MCYVFENGRLYNKIYKLENLVERYTKVANDAIKTIDAWKRKAEKYEDESKQLFKEMNRRDFQLGRALGLVPEDMSGYGFYSQILPALEELIMKAEGTLLKEKLLHIESTNYPKRND